MEGWFIPGLVAIVVIWAILIYNKFVSLRAQGDSSWSDIDVQLKRRYDLIPNLVETVKGYATHEKETLEGVVKARQLGIDASTVQDQAAAENVLTTALRGIFALAESYPDLKASINFLELKKQLSEIEDAVQNARRYYNAVVRDYNTKVDSFPDMAIARLFSFRTREYFELDDAAERLAPQVKF
ncbi:MAG: LemA family protein [Chromatiaceae bacterium]|jgi:LemA protein|nr:LemA family protein [Chromatiaceae bacterium]